MNKLIISSIVLVSLVLASCGGAKEESSKNTETSAPPNADQSKEMSYKVDTRSSVVNWTGTKIVVYDHTGTLNFTKGEVKVKGDKITGGGLIVDMKSMATTDDNYGEKNPKEYLVGHLMSDEFFAVEKFPVASLVFLGNDEVNLTIRDKTQKEKFTDFAVTEKDGKKVYSAKLKFDRQKYGVAFEGGIKDGAVSDEITLDVVLQTM